MAGRSLYGTNYTAASPATAISTAWRTLRTWVPSIHPVVSAYTGDKFRLEGSLFTGALSAHALFRIEADGERYRREERLEGRLPYIRDARDPTASSILSPTATMADCSASSPRNRASR
jgi:hypothetical protein